MSALRMAVLTRASEKEILGIGKYTLRIEERLNTHLPVGRRSVPSEVLEGVVGGDRDWFVHGSPLVMSTPMQV